MLQYNKYLKYKIKYLNHKYIIGGMSEELQQSDDAL